MPPTRTRAVVALRARARFVLPARVALLLASAAGVPGQDASSGWGSDPKPGSPSANGLQQARAWLARGEKKPARELLLSLLPGHPGSPAILREVLAASEDPAERARWTQALVDAACDERGQWRPDRATAALLVGPQAALELAAARATAVAELLRFAGVQKPGSGPGSQAIVRWAVGLAQQLMRETPALWRRHAASADALLASQKLDPQPVLTALRSLAESTAVRVGKDGAAGAALPLEAQLQAACCLAGLAAQAGFKDLHGPRPPDLKELGKVARDLRARLRARVAATSVVETVASLEARTPAERLAFTVDHAAISNPGVAVSPTGKYRVETTCGFETLLAAATTIELHHQRLADWFGKDPFGNQQGLVRIVPDHVDLEAEDAPFWWATGFHSPAGTCVVHHWQGSRALGRDLTHELTHRFDATLEPFLPAWLVEGRAVWTADSYRSNADLRFEPRKVETWSMLRGQWQGYTDPQKLRALLEGAVADYRHHYSGGYMLATYLALWRRDGREVFAERLRDFRRQHRPARAVALFEQCFCDGKDGRPSSLEGLTAELREFVDGFHHGEKPAPPWLSDYVAWFPQPAVADPDPITEDAPTFTRARERSEPWFGEGHARRAGRLLAGHGQPAAAIAALLLSQQVDEWSSVDAELLATLLQAVGRKDAAWSVRSEDARRACRPPAEPPPFAAGLPALQALSARHPVVARAFGSATTAAVQRAPEPLGLLGWIEDGLTHHEEDRQPGLWFEDGNDLHVGREKGREATGVADRVALDRTAFVRTRESFRAGQYVFRTRLQPTTAYVDGLVVLGGSRRDRNLRLSFGAGDIGYAEGDKETNNLIREPHFGMSGSWTCEGHLPGSWPSTSKKFKEPVASFALDVRVDGPVAEVWIEGERLFTYATADGNAIEGWIGFATSKGAMRLQSPTVERCDGRSPCPGIDLAAEGTVDLQASLHHRLAGLATAGAGTVAIVLPLGRGADDVVSGAAAAVSSLQAAIRDARSHPQAWSMLLPAALTDEQEAAALAAVPADLRERVAVARYRCTLPGRVPFLVFADRAGVVRAVQSPTWDGDVECWARCYRPE